MFSNGGLNPFQKHRSQTPIPLRYITGIELYWYKQYLLWTKGTPLLYNKVTITKINGLFMKVSARSNKSYYTDISLNGKRINNLV